MQRLLVSFLCALLFVPPAVAHPVPKTNRDRTIVVRVTAGALVVDYRLELDEGSIPDELTAEEKAHVTTRSELLQAFTQSFADTTCRTLDASLDGQELRFQCVQQKFTATDHVRCEYRFESRWALAADADHKVKFHDTNYNTDDFSRIHLYLAADNSVRLLSAKAPSAEMMSRSSDERKSGDGDRLRRATATFRLADSEALGVSKPSFPPDELLSKSEPDLPVSLGKATAHGAVTLSKFAPEEAAATTKPLPGTSEPTPSVTALPIPNEQPDATGASTVAESPSLWARIVHPNVLINLLLDSREGLIVLLLLAALAGAAHALTPGHGKTLVAAYLVGQRGTYWHAVILGIVTTLTHTAAVLVLAGVFLFVPVDQQRALTLQGLIGGFLIAGLGLWLLIRRLSGQADHFHVGGGHHHHGHEHTHNHDDSGIVVQNNPRKSGLGEVIALGMGGGILPCWDAVILLGFAISSGRASLGLPLLLAFSAGLASVLVVLGLVVVGAAHVARRAAPSSQRLEALVRPLPILSAIFVTLMGLWLCYGALNP